MDIVLKAIRDSVAQIKLAVAESTNISPPELECRLEGDGKLVIAPAARKHADQMRVLWVWLTEDDPEKGIIEKCHGILSYRLSSCKLLNRIGSHAAANNY